jgi:hypothetical protein
VPTSAHVREAIGEEAVGGEDRRRPRGRVWPVKLNTVVERGVNDHGWRLDDVVPAAEVIRRIDAELPCRGGSPC